MITVLQRQHVSKRDVSPVNLRARPTGVRWGIREETAPIQVASPRLILKFQPLKRSGPPRLRPTGERSFLRDQLVRGKHHRAVRRAEQRLQRRDVRQDLPRGHAELPRHRGGSAARNIVAAAARKRWLLPVLALVALALVLFAVARATGIFLAISVPLTLPQPRPALPAPNEVDQALYGLVIPEQAPAPEAKVNPVLLTSLKVVPYRTRAGDSISRIAARFNLNIDTLVSWNALRDARNIPVGTQLDVPNANGLKYTVRRGDTLQGIARSSGVDLNNILDWNRLSSSVISVGQELFLPGARMNTNELNRILGNLFMYPVLGRISSYFGVRPDPFTGVERFHNGVDIVNKPLTPIQAAMAGTVGDVGFSADYGYYVILKHSGGYQTLYGHLTRYLVARGQRVQQGQKIGELGTTGYSTGPHLHFSIFHGGEAVDPLRFLK
jgi:murein DD-endopeptidase MepM/ murein hydrolase activator NlpD